MSRLDNVIKDIENVNKECHAWIYDENGNIISGFYTYYLQKLD